MELITFSDLVLSHSASLASALYGYKQVASRGEELDSSFGVRSVKDFADLF